MMDLFFHKTSSICGSAGGLSQILWVKSNQIERQTYFHEIIINFVVANVTKPYFLQWKYGFFLLENGELFLGS